MGDIWFYRLIFVALVVLGIVLPESIPFRLALVRGGIEGLLLDERISKERLEFIQQELLRERSKGLQQQPDNIEALTSGRDLTLPADPDEGY